MDGRLHCAVTRPLARLRDRKRIRGGCEHAKAQRTGIRGGGVEAREASPPTDDCDHRVVVHRRVRRRRRARSGPFYSVFPPPEPPASTTDVRRLWATASVVCPGTAPRASARVKAAAVFGVGGRARHRGGEIRGEQRWGWMNERLCGCTAAAAGSRSSAPRRVRAGLDADAAPGPVLMPLPTSWDRRPRWPLRDRSFRRARTPERAFVRRLLRWSLSHIATIVVTECPTHDATGRPPTRMALTIIEHLHR